ncbi:allantoicase [Bermanella marisrubri]|uniref:Probable allantoicase n=1 Tax=Bermanella marisrubri TaxID=207949 RepID=Q1N1R4_9GAMM|nr:allantoicase [Bermanella marisrubri]EAT12217.1 Allantoicase [Oceanobacter sp. RED65] [Bermanella marisrubri]QIZ83686.1 allantoicase [Bermanella marisrubri]
MQQQNDHPYKTWIDLAAQRLGGQALQCSDDFFAEMENLLKPAAPVFIDDKYTDRGKWMDGWESRRKRVVGHDWCVIKLGAKGIIHGVNVCTRFFAGNAPQSVSIEGCVSEIAPNDSTEWQPILIQSNVNPDSDNYFGIESQEAFTHIRLNIFPDGGVARLRVYGEPVIDWDWFLPGEPIDLAYVKNGGRPMACSDMFFSNMENLIMPNRGKDMGDGWETKRRRGGRECDWIIVKLGAKGSIEKVLVDTAHFKGNYPESFTLEAACLEPHQSPDENTEWHEVIGREKLTADSEHFYRHNIQNKGQHFTHVRLNIFPDGGVSRLRVYGFLAEKEGE